MAATVSLSFSFEPQPHNLHRHHHHNYQLLYHYALFKARKSPFLTPNHNQTYSIFTKSDRNNLIFSFSTSPSPSSSSQTPRSTLTDPLHTGRFLTDEELEKLQFLENFRYHQRLGSGSMYVRVMRQDDTEMTVALLAEGFGEFMLLPVGYKTVLRYLVKQYLVERRILMPHTATLVAFYRGKEEEDEQLAGTVEISFNKRGANSSTPTPNPPKNSPYISNMSVQKQLRRRGVGWHLLKASEELIPQMSHSSEVYLHCRMIDEAPLNMYTRAGYSIVKTDNLLILLLLQKRKHLMFKKLSVRQPVAFAGGFLHWMVTINNANHLLITFDIVDVFKLMKLAEMLPVKI